MRNSRFVQPPPSLSPLAGTVPAKADRNWGRCSRMASAGIQCRHNGSTPEPWGFWGACPKPASVAVAPARRHHRSAVSLNARRAIRSIEADLRWIDVVGSDDSSNSKSAFPRPGRRLYHQASAGSVPLSLIAHPVDRPSRRSDFSRQYEKPPWPRTKLRGFFFAQRMGADVRSTENRPWARWQMRLP